MIPEIGHFLLILSWVIAIALMGLSYPRLSATQCTRLTLLHLGCTLTSLLILAMNFYQLDLSVKYVAQNAHAGLPVYYRVCAVWGAHEGSLLLWYTFLSMWANVFCLRHMGHLPLLAAQKITALFGGILSGIGALLIWTSNPFARLLPFPPDAGMDLNPLLQDWSFVIHPPILYLGYSACAAIYAIALGGGAAAFHLLRTYTIGALVFLTAGIFLGSFWAYYELGWGGFWFWDPVENASLMPWLIAVSLLHLLKITRTKPKYQRFALMLAPLGFLITLIGTFLVRSGVITSVHAFASDPIRGKVLLLLIVLYTLPILWQGWQPSSKTAATSSPWVFRQGALLLTSLFLLVIAGIVLLGTIYPVLAEIFFNQSLSVGPPYFNQTIGPLAALLIVLLCITFFKDKFQLGALCAHTGVFVVTISLILTLNLSTEYEMEMGVGDTIVIKNYTFEFAELKPTAAGNYQGVQGTFHVYDSQHHRITTLLPEKRYYTVREIPITETAIYLHGVTDLYVAMAEPLDNTHFAVRIYLKPFVRGLWLGGFLMVCGLWLSRRKRHVKPI